MIARLSVMSGCASFAIFLSFATMADAKDIYRWVDEQGRTHISDTVPPQYSKSAQRIDTHASQVSESDRAQAAARAAREKTALDGMQAAPASAPHAEQRAPQSKPGSANTDDKSAQCAQMRRAYAESQACFAPYRNANGSVRSEAYQRCPQIPDPSPDCGIPSN